jgi:hypothetical protein
MPDPVARHHDNSVNQTAFDVLEELGEGGALGWGERSAQAFVGIDGD